MTRKPAAAAAAGELADADRGVDGGEGVEGGGDIDGRSLLPCQHAVSTVATKEDRETE
jgi:hypothetical protein